MLKVAGGFARSRSGSMMPLFFLSLAPLITAVGFSVDYTNAVQTRSDMQEALDAATLAITTLPATTTQPVRQQALQDNFAANNGRGTATLVSFNVAADGTVTAQTSASYAMPTNFMTIARINSVPVAVASGVNKAPALVQATFKIDKVSGYWNKIMTLYGTNFGATTPQKLMTASYVYSPYTYSYKVSGRSYSITEPKGYGTTTISLVNGSTSTVVQTQTCTTIGSTAAFTSPPAGAILSPGQYDSNSGKTIYYQTICATTNVPATGSGANVDVSQMGQLFLQMDVTTGNKATFKTTDATTSDHLYLGTTPTPLTEVDAGKLIDIFNVVPCSQTSYQAWEDGGTTLPADYTNADFFYNISGKCDFNQRPSLTALTQ
ncbi:pilus assembly protein [Mesorhizobium sp. B2-4-19]|uniref:TadE/TadG family type IV pilus assembly protein n=1 Tax=Mesorhizobium sp. B2-4-19 TaxID=2589930 RepID=UPI00112DA7B9|nr:TadE/TadG family type IV pilus assembly protein [Mesorhizobium sp. B2-4-19]TPK63064.1 pilus assembly protein [Mesorhizobium sp. B2-4-19]